MYTCHVCNVQLKTKGNHENSKKHQLINALSSGKDEKKIGCESKLEWKCRMLEERCKTLKWKCEWVDERQKCLSCVNPLLEGRCESLLKENASLKEGVRLLQEENNLLKKHIKIYDFLKDAYTTMRSIIFSSEKTYQKIIKPRCEETDCSDCFVCGESKAELFWTCSTCLNQMCIKCMLTWRRNTDKCPFCRCQL
jgi:hypothetical protein